MLVKRFSAKEEPGRVAAAVIHADDAAHPRWGIENHLDYFHDKGKPLGQWLARGLAAFLDTTLVDSFFRQFNGHTQVNATDLRSLPCPSSAQLTAIGKKVGAEALAQEAVVIWRFNSRSR